MVALSFVGLVESVTVIDGVASPAAVGVPEIRPEVLIDSSRWQTGRGERVRSGAALMRLPGRCRAHPTMPADKEVVVNDTPGLIVMDALAVALRGGADESVTMRITGLGPAAVGVPVIWPAALIASPAGRPVAVKVYGAVPPLAVTVRAVYTAPTNPAGNMMGVMTGGVMMVMDRGALPVRWLESVTVMVTVPVPAAVGVPVIWPPVLMPKARR